MPAAIEPFWAMEVLERAQSLERDGASVIHFEVGEPAFPPPAEAVNAARRALAAGDTRYTDSRGVLELRQEIARVHSGRCGRPVDPDCVVVTNGTSPGLLLVFSLLLEAGDEVILGTPHYACYPNIIRALGGIPVLVPTQASDGYQLNPTAARAALSRRTRAILVGSPANPTGAVQGRAVLEELANLGPPLVCDEIYAGLEYGDERALSGLALSDRAFVLDGFSKRYAMTGFRLGYVIAPGDSIRRLQSLAQNLFISASSFVQAAGIAALKSGERHIRKMRSELAERRKQMLAGVRSLGFHAPFEPAGAFYIFADASRFDRDSRRLAFDLLERAHVAVGPGVDFGAAGEGHLRFSYTASEADIDTGLERLARILS